MDLQFRQVEVPDAQFLWECVKDPASVEAAGGKAPHSGEQNIWFQRILHSDLRGKVFVVCQGSESVGVVMEAPKRWHIVHPKFRRQGIGKKLRERTQGE